MTVEPFRAISVSRLAHQLKAEGRSIIHMEFGQPSTGAPSRAIAEAHGGRVQLDEGPGVFEGFGPGLRVALVLPAATGQG